MPLIEVDDIELYYEKYGEGPPLLLVTGIPGIARDWRPFAERLANTFTIIAFDNRGSGESDKPESDYSIDQFADDTARLIEELELDTPHVFGVSMGGMIAQALAIAHGDAISNLVLGCTHCGGEHVIPPSDEVNEAFAYDGEDWEHRIELLVPHAFAPDFQASNPDVYDDFVERKTADPQPLFAYRRQIGAVARHDTCEQLADIDNPTLIITGMDDAIIPAENSKYLHAQIPDSRLERIQEAGHLFFIEKPSESAKLLRSFLPT